MSRLVIARSNRDIERAITHPDIEREIAMGSRYRFAYDDQKRCVVPIPNISGGSFLTGTNVELIYSNPIAGAAKSTFTTEFQINDLATMGQPPTLPAYFFMPSRARGQAIRIVARGIITNSASAPTWAWTFRLNPVITPAIPPTGPNIGSTATLTALTSLSNQLWEAELDVQLTIEGVVAAQSTLRGLGILFAPTLFTVASAAIFGGGASPGTVATFDQTLLNTLTVGVTCGTSAGTNIAQVLQLLVFGLN